MKKAEFITPLGGAARLYNRELLALTAQQWVNAMNTTDNFSAEIRSKDAVDKHADQDLSAFNDGMGSSTHSVI